MRADRRTVAVFVVGLIGVLALVVSAAMLTDPAGEEASAGWINLGSGEHPQGELFSGTLDLPIPSLYLDVLWTALAVSAVVFLLASLLLLDTEELVRIVLGALAVVIPGAVIGLLMGNVGMGGTIFSMNGTVANETGMSLSTGESAPPGSGGLSPYLLGAGILVILVTVGVLFARSGDETAIDIPADDADESAGEQRLVSLGEAAGRAAAGIAASESTADNAVYEAWIEMTDALAVADPETTTSGEFADAAVDAGMDPEHVRELTRLFEDVRYGDASVSQARAERARAALERIEATYAGEQS
ncbi:DUF4129 domain-containing protein [Halorhabdus sp. BNX81]|uniref:DUF4129 domain-containing protein n=1 Tax=Halorhabdus sp. BNX81 TaxID=2980181 RepID=UPI0023DD3A82|nr:DUF4129 domain-containing protein [Halorhabdus sp. BNX81]WEL22187.1 Uncharacterized protein HBNXHr_2138 [Halorhabdus sp. BNX81]